MLPEGPLLRDPLVYPPPEPPLAFANDIVGAPMRESIITVAMSFVVFNMSSFLSIPM
jgi:hypothetical protein